MESVEQEKERIIQYLPPPKRQLQCKRGGRPRLLVLLSQAARRGGEEIVKEVHSPAPCVLAMASGSRTSSARRLIAVRPPTTPRRPGTAGSSLEVARSPATSRALDFDFGEDQIESFQKSCSQHSSAGAARLEEQSFRPSNM